VTYITDLDVLEADTSRDNRNGCGQSDPPKPGAADQYLREQIVAVIPRLERYARVLTRDVTAADDLVQDCLARALEKIHMWQPGTDLRAWLFTILYRQYISHARRDARRREGGELPESHRSLALSANQTARLELRDLESALAKLPEEQRTVILLVGLEGMAYDEAASVVKIPVGTVRSRVARGRESLREMTGLFPGRHSPRLGKAAESGSSRRLAAWGNLRLVSNEAISAAKSQEVVQ
jgi:RNA polymerase sigma-70 factor (ECF subfamily)